MFFPFSYVTKYNNTHCIACVDIGICFEVFQNFLQVSSSGSSEEAGIVIGLQ